MKKPSKVIINMGLARCGTTATAKLFEEGFPGFSTPRNVKELKYFLSDERKTEDYFDKFDFEDGDILFESSPPYMHNGLENFREVVGRISDLKRLGIEVHILFHARNLVKRAFSHYWHDINGHYAIQGSRWNVRGLEHPERFNSLYSRPFGAELLNPRVRSKFLPPFAEMVEAAINTLGRDSVMIAHTQSLDGCITDMLSRLSLPHNDVAVPRLPGAYAPVYFHGGDNGETYHFKGRDGTEEIEVPAGHCLLFARRHREILSGEHYNLEKIIGASDRWSYRVERSEIEDSITGYLSDQKTKLATLPEGCFLNGCRTTLIKDIATIPEEMKIRRTEPNAGVVHQLVWDKQAENAERDGKVTVGRNDRLFLHFDMNQVLPQHTGEIRLTQGEVTQWCELLEARSAYCAHANIAYSMVFAPDTHAVYHEDLPQLDGVEVKRPVLQILEAYAGNNLFYPYAQMRAARSRGEVCDVTDSHWSPFGAYIAYRHVLSHLNMDLRILEDDDIRLLDQERVGDLGAKFVPPRLGRSTQVLFKKSNAQKIWKNGVTNRGHMSFWKGHDPDQPRGLLLTDSYGWKFQRFMAESFSHLFVVHSPLLEKEAIERFKPQVVISLMAERFIPKVPDDHSKSTAIHVARSKNSKEEYPDLASMM